VDIASPVRDLSFDERLVRYPELESKREELARLLGALDWKLHLPSQFPVAVCILGGTGTGKSTLFNSLAGGRISAVGTRRPCTARAVILVHEQWEKLLRQCPCVGVDGDGDAEVVTHQDAKLEHLLLIDTPDFDSVEITHRRTCEHFFIMSDVLVFVTSQEKYADMAGLEMLERASHWGKSTVFVMNKVASDQAYNDLVEKLRALGHPFPPLRVERLDTPVDYIPDLRSRPGLEELISLGNNPDAGAIREKEVQGLFRRVIQAVDGLDRAVGGERQRIAKVNAQITVILQSVSKRMEDTLDEVVSKDVEEQIRARLSHLLRKYDILFVPRMMVRNTLRKIFRSVAEIFSPGTDAFRAVRDERGLLREELAKARSVARLEPAEAAVAQLNLGVAELLSSDTEMGDLREIARTSVPRWDPEEIRALYDEQFPGVEHLLEEEFARFRDGLSVSDEIWLYGSYTVWALFLITAEIIVGGGFTLLDALLNTAIVPFIPKWLINLKVIDLLREIGDRLDKQHRAALKGIVTLQAELYIRELSGLVPDNDQWTRLRNLKIDLIGGTGVPRPVHK
jgi:GTP-binding protein EngB required for normal cell division